MFWQKKITIKQKTVWVHDGPGLYSHSSTKCKPECRYCTQKTINVHYHRPALFSYGVTAITDGPVISIIGAVHCVPVRIAFYFRDHRVFSIFVKRVPVYYLGFGANVHNKKIQWPVLSEIIIWNDRLFAWFFRTQNIKGFKI